MFLIPPEYHYIVLLNMCGAPVMQVMPVCGI